MKILEELRAATGFETFTCLTYGADLAWFESALLRPLQARGVRRFLIMADQRRISCDLESSPHLPGGLGLHYLLHGVTGRGAFGSFHPKLYLLAGEQTARLYVGSGNLTRGGLDRNLEVFERWDAGREGPIPGAFAVARRILEGLLAGFDADDRVEREHLEHTFRFDRRGYAGSDAATVVASPGPLLDQVQFGPPGCEVLRLVAPFFDESGEAVRRLVRRTRPRELEVIVHPRMTNITRRIVGAIEAMNGRVLKVCPRDEDEADRPVHGKLLYARAAGWRLGISGSANLSVAAWQGHNHELIAVRRGADADAVNALIDDLPCEPLTEEDLELFERNAAQRARDNEEAVIPRGPSLRFTRWARSDRVLVRPAEDPGEPFAIELRGPHGVVRAADATRGEGGWEFAAPAVIQRGAPCLARISGAVPGPWSVVQDPEELLGSTQPGRRERGALERLLDTPGFDREGARQLMELIADIQRKRVERAAAAADPAGDVDGTAPGLRTVSLQDFERRGRDAADSRSSGLVPLASVRLMNRLLFGDDERDEPDQETDSELDADDLAEEEILARMESAKRSGAGPATKDAMDAFLRASSQARGRYIQTLRGRRVDPYHLLDHLMLLAAPLYYMLRGRTLGDSAFRAEMVVLLRALVGEPHAPIYQAIRELDAGGRNELWDHMPVFYVVMLLVYNVCVADAELHDPRSPAAATFTNSHPVLWLRHLVRLVDAGRLELLLAGLPEVVGRLKKGLLWPVTAWPRQRRSAPFEEFVRTSVRDALALDRVEQQIRGLLPQLCRPGAAVEDGDLVVGLAAPGLIAAGWAEPEEPGNPARLRSGAFEEVEVSGPGSSYLRKMSSPPLSTVYGLEALRSLAGEDEGRLDSLGLKVLARIGG